MLALRLIALAVVVAVGASLALYVLRRDRRYLRLAWQILLGSVVFAAATGAGIFVERLLTRG